eukprot:6784568-Prymnesium_polylepis.1
MSSELSIHSRGLVSPRLSLGRRACVQSFDLGTDYCSVDRSSARHTRRCDAVASSSRASFFAPSAANPLPTSRVRGGVTRSMGMLPGQVQSARSTLQDPRMRATNQCVTITGCAFAQEPPTTGGLQKCTQLVISKQSLAEPRRAYIARDGTNRFMQVCARAVTSTRGSRRSALRAPVH